MNKLIIKLTCILLTTYMFSIHSVLLAQSSQTPLCIDAQPFCSDASNPTFPNQTNTDVPVGPDYGCLERIPGVNDVNAMVNPQWFYFKVSQSGTIKLKVKQNDTLQNPIDLDFVMWGPFPDLATGCTQVMNGITPIQCSSNPSSEETIGLGVEGGGDYWSNFPFGNFIDGTSTPPSANVGEVYIVLLTNADGKEGTISLNQISGTGATDCNIITPCNITITATPTACAPTSNTYTVSGQIVFTDAPTTGTLIVEDCNGDSTTFSAPFTSPQTYSITNITSDGLPCNITAYFSDNTVCSSTANYQSPSPCNCIAPSIVVTDLTICSSDTTDLANAIDPASDPATITYYATKTDANNATNSINSKVNVAGSYWIRAENINDASCYTVVEVQLNVITINYTVAITDEICSGKNGEITITPTGGISPYTYSIDNGVTTNTNGIFTNITAGTYQIVITDSNGCKGYGNEIVANIGAPKIDQLDAVNPTCIGYCDGSITVSISGGNAPYKYLWMNANGDTIEVNKTNIKKLCSGDYTLMVSNVDGSCSITDTITLIKPSKPNASFVLTNFCEGQKNNAIIKGDSGGVFYFNPPVSDGAIIDSTTGEIYNGVGGTTYTVEYNTNGACPKSSKEQVTVYNTPTANFTANPITTDLNATTITFSNKSTQGDNYIWDFGDSSPFDNGFNVKHTYPNNMPGQYIVTLIVTTDQGCIDSTFKTITITYPKANYRIPNVFTPNGDNKNDVFKLIQPENIIDINVNILNRWGVIVFSSNKIQFKWNGRVNNSGQMCTDGIYFYRIEIKTANGENQLKHGFVHLSRGN